MAKVLVSLTPQLLELVDRLVKEGFYSSRSEVVRDALRKLLHHEPEGEFDLEDILPGAVTVSDDRPDWIYS